VLSPKPVAEDKFVADWSKDGIVSFRDWSYALISGNGEVRQQGRTCQEELIMAPHSGCEERVAYLRSLASFVWLHQEWGIGTLTTPRGELSVPNRDGYTGELLSLSPDERYIAAGPGLFGKTVRIYDLTEKRWFDLGTGIIHPDEWWPREVPSWSPWFADSSELAFFSTEGLVITSPNGTHRRIIARPQEPAGLAVPSPDGSAIAYATFASHPNRTGSSPTWNCTGIWLVRLREPSAPKRLTSASPASTIDLHWLDNQHLVFDRVQEGMPPKARIWMVSADSR
jgi:hypothetical protein